MDREDRVPGVVGALQHRLQLEARDRCLELVGLARELRRHGLVGLGLEQLRHLAGAGEPALDVLPRLDPAFERLELLNRLPGAVRVGPKARLRLRRFQRPQTIGPGRQVKESLGDR